MWNAVYHPAADGKNNITQFELIPWLRHSCATLAEARTLLEKANIVNIPFSEQLPLAQLHWLIADKTGSIVVESTADGLHIYDNPVGVLTNNPPFPQQLFALNNYRALSPPHPCQYLCRGGWSYRSTAAASAGWACRGTCPASPALCVRHLCG